MPAERQLVVEDPWWGEHVHRYIEAARRAGPSDEILDVACGTGFGTAILARATSGMVHGCDIADDAVAEARRTCADPRIRFMRADGTSLPYADAHFDFVVSLETIEHVHDDRSFLRELARVLKPAGTIVLSTPNRRVTSPDGHVINPFHVREYARGELERLLGEAFAETRWFGQRYARFESGHAGRGRARLVERLLYQRGVRKLPLPVRNAVSRVAVGHPHYPQPSDFDLVDDPEAVEQCRTFFVVCRRQGPEARVQGPG